MIAYFLDLNSTFGIQIRPKNLNSIFIIQKLVFTEILKIIGVQRV